MRISFAIFLGATILCSAPALRAQAADVVEAPAEGAAEGAVVTFEADALSYDENSELLTATGDVLLVHEGQRLTADTVSWDRNSDVVRASGQVLLIDAEGNRVVAESVELDGSLRNGAIEQLLIVLEGGGRIAAASGRRVDGRSTLRRAVYSPCDVVDADTGCPQQPLWALKAARVTHDPVRGRISYRRPRLEFFGMPLVVLPGLSHPDGFDRNQSGILAPDVRISRELGVELSVPYYWALAPNRDLTTTVSVFTEAPPMLGLEYRHLFAGGPVVLGGRITHAEGERVDLATGEIVRSPARIRGYFDGKGQLEHGNGWRSSFSARLTNDDNFLGRYQISMDTRLRSTYALERFAPDHYLSIAGWAFQGLRQEDRAGRTPIALPLVDFFWRPQLEALGGSLLVRANSLAINRTDGQSMARALASVQWDRRFYTSLGQRLTFTALARGDLYHNDDSLLADSPFYAGQDGWKGRVVPLAAIDVDWPLSGPLFGGTQVISPRVQLVASTASANVGIPNEDSRAIDLEDSNLFALNRFPGHDRWEGGARITYGVEWRWRGKGIAADAQIGQSYRLDDQSDLFPDGTGLSTRASDIVGRYSLRIGRFVELVQRLRLDKDNLAVRRNEADIAVGSRQSFVSVGYSRYNRNILLEDLVDHEEVRAGARVAIGRYWSVFGSAVVDLTSNKESPHSDGDGWQPIRHRVGLRYSDECFDFGLTWRRNYVDNPNARRGNTFLFTLALRNLG